MCQIPPAPQTIIWTKSSRSRRHTPSAQFRWSFLWNWNMTSSISFLFFDYKTNCSLNIEQEILFTQNTGLKVMISVKFGKTTDNPFHALLSVAEDAAHSRTTTAIDRELQKSEIPYLGAQLANLTSFSLAHHSSFWIKHNLWNHLQERRSGYAHTQFSVTAKC